MPPDFLHGEDSPGSRLNSNAKISHMKIKSHVLTVATFAALSVGAHAASTFADAHLVYYWDFDNATSPATQTSYVSPTGTGTGAVTPQGTLADVVGAGLVGASATDRAVGYADNGDFYLSTTGLDYSNLSLSIHVKSANPGSFNDFLSIGTNDANQFYLESTTDSPNNGGLSLYHNGTPGGAAPAPGLDSAAGLANDVWHQIGLTSNGSLLKLYVDGASVASAAYTGTGAINLFQAAARLGAGGSARRITSALDDLSLWNVALDDSQMSFLNSNVATTLVPEPSAALLGALGALALLRRRRN